MMTLKELRNTALPEEFLELLPEDNCDICGAELHMTETLTELVCSNPFCPEHAVQRLVTLLVDLGIKGLGASKCRSFLDRFKVYNPYVIFAYNPEEDGVLFDGCSMSFSESVYESINKVRSMMPWEYLKRGNLPGIRDSAQTLMDGYTSIEEFFEDVEYGGVEFIQTRLSSGSAGKGTSEDDEYDTGGGDVSIRATQKYQTLMTFKDSVLQFVDSVNLIDISEKKAISVCISRAVGAPYANKVDFVNAMNNKYADKVHIQFLESVSKSTDYVLWSKEGVETTKIKKANKLGLPILTGKEFDELLATW